MPLSIGPGLADWITKHAATPLGDEDFLTPGYQISAVPIQIANSEGKAVRTIVGYDKLTGAILEPGPGVVVPPPPPPSALPLLYDSVSAADIPASAQAVAGYVDGAYAWSKADWDRFPGAHQLTITVFGGQLASACDCETGDLTPDQAAGWIMDYPGNIIYCNLSTAPAVVDAVTRAGMNYPGQWYLWVADWTGQPHLPTVPGAEVVACQYADPAAGSGGNFDVSVTTPKLFELI